jgi:tight adherence protein B
MPKGSSSLFVRNGAVVFSLFLFAISLTHSIVIALALALVSSLILEISRRRGEELRTNELARAVPEIIDYVISGVQSGLSLTESLSSLSIRGPEQSREFFLHLRNQLHEGATFDEAITTLQESFSLRSADQLFEALLFAKSLGGNELLALLRQLGDFTRADLALRDEISSKQGWIRNSAHLSAIAPWILLLLLSAQPSTAQAFATPSGISILLAGIVMTTLAYLWMGRLGRLPQPARIFGAR